MIQVKMVVFRPGILFIRVVQVKVVFVRPFIDLKCVCHGVVPKCVIYVKILFVHRIILECVCSVVVL